MQAWLPPLQDERALLGCVSGSMRGGDSGLLGGVSGSMRGSDRALLGGVRGGMRRGESGYVRVC